MNQSFTIDDTIYSREDILSAIEDYQEVTSISFEENTLTISWDSDEEIQEIFLEFMNYVLSL